MIHMFLLLFLVSLTCPVVQPIMSPHTAWSGTYYSFTLDEPYALFLVDHSYLTCMFLPFAHRRAPTNCLYEFPPELRFSTYAHLSCIISHCITLPHNPTVFTLHHTWRQSLAHLLPSCSQMVTVFFEGAGIFCMKRVNSDEMSNADELCEEGVGRV